MKIRKNIAVSESGFVFDPNSGDSYSLNATGCEIINLLNAGKTGVEIKDILLAKYEVNASTFNLYFDDFAQMLRHFNLTEADQ